MLPLFSVDALMLYWIVRIDNRNGELKMQNQFGYAAAAMACLMALLSTQASAFATDLEREAVFDLPQQPLEKALFGFSEQAHIQVLTSSAVIPDRIADGISGRMRIRRALDQLLHGTHLKYALINAGTIAIQSAESEAASRAADGAVLLASTSRMLLAQSSEPSPAPTAQKESSTHRPPPSDSIEEIVVTATKRGEETAQSVPLSITALSARGLKESGATELSEWSHSVPGLVFQDQGPGDKRYIIRGVQSIGAPTVGVYLDNAVISGSNGEDDGGGKNIDIRLFDIDRIEVLRGPQGTLYGAGSLSGTIRLVTKQPKLGQFEGNAGAELSTTEKGGRNYSVNGTINLPLVDGKLAMRAVGWRVDDSGFIDNIRLGLRDINTEKTNGGRASLTWAVTDRLKVTGSVLYQEQNIGGKSFFFPTDGDLKNSEFTQGPRTDRATISQLEVNYQFDKFNLDVSSAYFKRFVDFKFDSTPILIFFGVPDLPAVTLQPEDSSIFTNEARLSSKLDGPFQFVAGTLYQKLKRSFVSSVVTVDANGLATQTDPNIFGRTSSKKVEQYAVFGEGTYQVTPKLSMIVGLRWFKSTEDANSQNTFPFFGGPPELPRVSHSSETKVTPKVSVSYQINSDALVYALAAQGFRQGGTNDAGFGAIIQVPEGFKSDSLWNYEVGLKSSWLERHLIFNLTAYAIRWTDIQTLNRTPGLGFPYIGNAGKASSDGLEAELTARPISGLELQGSISVQNARLTEDQPLAATDNDAGRAGDRIPNTPKFTASGATQYTHALTSSIDGVVRAQVSYVGSSQTYFSDRSAFYQRLAPYALNDFRLGLQAERWNATVFVKNAFDRRAEVDKLYQTDSPLSVFTARPRTIGVSADYRF